LKKLASIVILFALISWSCAKKEIPADTSILGLDYYPIKTGKFVVYEVDSTVYTELPRDTIYYKYLIKEKIADSFKDNENKTAYRIERYIKKYNASVAYENMSWQIKEVWMLNADDKRIQISESNIRFTKLIFPVENKASWNGNAANNLGEQTYFYDYVDQSDTINGLILDKTLLVKQIDYTTLISSEIQQEKYAKGVGLVSREITNILSNNVVAGTTAAERIESGIIYKQHLLSYGYE